MARPKRASDEGRGTVRAVAHRCGWSKFEVQCPTCHRKHTLTQVLDNRCVLGDDVDDTFRIHDNGEAASLYPKFVCRNSNCSFEGTVVFAPAK